MITMKSFMLWNKRTLKNWHCAYGHTTKILLGCDACYAGDLIHQGFLSALNKHDLRWSPTRLANEVKAGSDENMTVERRQQSKHNANSNFLAAYKSV